MTFAGWLVMLTSVFGTIALFVWCIYKVFTIPDESEHLHGFEQPPPDIDSQEKDS